MDLGISSLTATVAAPVRTAPTVAPCGVFRISVGPRLRLRRGRGEAEAWFRGGGAEEGSRAAIDYDLLSPPFLGIFPPCCIL
jgi:hypothetical protein